MRIGAKLNGARPLCLQRTEHLDHERRWSGVHDRHHIPDPCPIGETVDATVNGKRVRVTLLNRDWLKIGPGALYRIRSAVSENGSMTIYALESIPGVIALSGLFPCVVQTLLASNDGGRV